MAWTWSSSGMGGMSTPAPDRFSRAAFLSMRKAWISPSSWRKALAPSKISWA